MPCARAQYDTVPTMLTKIITLNTMSQGEELITFDVTAGTLSRIHPVTSGAIIPGMTAMEFAIE